MLSLTHVMVRSAEGASRTTHGGRAAPGFRSETNSFTRLQAGTRRSAVSKVQNNGNTLRLDGLCETEALRPAPERRASTGGRGGRPSRRWPTLGPAKTLTYRTYDPPRRLTASSVPATLKQSSPLPQRRCRRTVFATLRRPNVAPSPRLRGGAGARGCRCKHKASRHSARHSAMRPKPIAGATR